MMLPPAIRRTGSKRDDGPAERLTFKREQRAQLADVDQGALVSLPNGERFEVLDVAADMTGRPQLVVRSPTHHEKEKAMSTIAPPVKPLATVDVSVPSSLVPPPGTGGLGRTTVTVPLAPKPASIAQGLGVSGSEFALTYADEADVQAIEASGETDFSVPNVPGVLRFTGHAPSHDGRATVFTAVDASQTLGDETLRKRQIDANAAYERNRVAAQNAQNERIAKTAAAARLAAIEEAWDALSRREQLVFLASKVAQLDAGERFAATNPAARGTT